MVIRKTGTSLVCLLLILGSAYVTSAQTLQLPSIVTVGLGYVITKADRVVVSLSIETQDESAETATAQTTAIGETIRRELAALDLAGLEFIPGRMSIWPQRGTGSRPSTYRASSTLGVVLSDEGDMGRVIDIAMRLGAASVQNVKFQATDLEAAAKQALTLAVEDAMAKAEVISKATDTRVVTIRRVTDANKVEVYNPSDPVLVELGEAPKTPFHLTVERGEILVQVEVTMEFDLAAVR